MTRKDLTSDPETTVTIPASFVKAARPFAGDGRYAMDHIQALTASTPADPLAFAAATNGKMAIILRSCAGDDDVPGVRMIPPEAAKAVKVTMQAAPISVNGSAIQAGVSYPLPDGNELSLLAEAFPPIHDILVDVPDNAIRIGFSPRLMIHVCNAIIAAAGKDTVAELTVTPPAADKGYGIVTNALRFDARDEGAGVEMTALLMPDRCNRTNHGAAEDYKAAIRELRR